METVNNELTPERSLQLINETLDNSRRDILRQSSAPIILWGTLLFIFSLAIFILWNRTGSPVWNFLWFAMTLLGFVLRPILIHTDKSVPCNTVSKMLTATWCSFGAFAVSTALISIFVVPVNMTVAIALLFGLAETLSGFLLKSWPVIISGYVIAVGGAIAGGLLNDARQLLVFTICGVVLALTGVIIKVHNK